MKDQEQPAPKFKMTKGFQQFLNIVKWVVIIAVVAYGLLVVLAPVLNPIIWLIHGDNP